MTEKKQGKIRLKNARPYNWYLDFKKREQEAEKKRDENQSVDANGNG